MDNQSLHRALKKLTSITPDAQFMARSRASLFASTPTPSAQTTLLHRIFEHLTMSGALVLASLLLFALISGVTYLRPDAPSSLSNVAETQKIAEADTVTFDIHLKEAVYFEETNDQIDQALTELSKP